MNYCKLKKLKINIDAQKLKVAAAREQAVSASSKADGMPRNSSMDDRVGMSVGQIIHEEEKLNALYDQLTESLKAIPDEYIKTLIHCKIVKGWSWNRIAQALGGGNTGDSIRKMVFRYSW